MNKEYWHRKWECKEIGFNQLQPNKFLQRYFSTLGLTAGCRVFVPLCGQSIDMLWLAGQGYQVIGVELSKMACGAFFEENQISVKITELDDFTLYSGREITIFCGDFFKLNRVIIDKIDAVYDRAALIALPEDMRPSYAKHLVELMIPTTAMILITMLYDQNAMQGPPFSVDENEVAALYGAHFDIKPLCRKQFEAPDHLKDKGLLQATEQVYSLMRKRTE